MIVAIPEKLTTTVCKPPLWFSVPKYISNGLSLIKGQSLASSLSCSSFPFMVVDKMETLGNLRKVNCGNPDIHWSSPRLTGSYLPQGQGTTKMEARATGMASIVYAPSFNFTIHK